jgi:hypothetical protein
MHAATREKTLSELYRTLKKGTLPFTRKMDPALAS